MSEKREKALRRLLKLIRHKESAERIGNLAEAAAFAAKIQEQLLAYKITEDELGASGEAAGENPYVKSVLYPYEYGETLRPERMEHWEDLADVVAKAHYCRLLIIEGTNVTMMIGRKLDVEVATYVFYRLARYAREACERDREAAKKRAQRAETGLGWVGNEGFRRSYFAGFIVAINERLQSQKARLELQAGACTALVRAERDIEQLQANITGGRSAGSVDASPLVSDPFAWLQGHATGKAANLTADALPSGEAPAPSEET